MAHEAQLGQGPAAQDSAAAAHARHPDADLPHEDPVVIDCDRCGMRGIGCGDCVVTVLLGGPPFGVALNDEERDALDVLAAAGLVPPLRMVESVESRHPDPA
jgi:hypothetical protein